MDRYDTLWRRVLAGFVDALVLLPIGLADSYLSAPERGGIVVLAWSTLSYNIYWLYSVLLHARRGQTLGKMAAGITVFAVSEERLPTLRQAFLRDAFYVVLNCASLFYLFTLVLSGRYARNAELTGRPAELLAMAGVAWFLLEIVTTLTNRKRRALHDYIAGTVVVRNGVPAMAEEDQPTLIRSGLPLVCPRCASRYPSRYWFTHPNRPESPCTACPAFAPATTGLQE